MAENNEVGNTETDTSNIPKPINLKKIDFNLPGNMIGQQLEGRFLIEKDLTVDGADTGGVGVVYLARDTKLLGKEVVVKILKDSAMSHEDVVRKFKHEKEALIRIDHPGIVRILDSGTFKDGNPYIVMEYIEGHSLRRELEIKGKLPLDFAAHVIEAMTDAIEAAHEKGILHRDIKPANIMITPQSSGFSRVRLIDFGIARVSDATLAPVTEVGRPIGTVIYMAPEQLMGSVSLTPAVDVYAAAIVAYEMLTGELPFKPKTIYKMYQMEKEGVQVPPRQLRPEIPLEAERILLSALEFDVDKRPQNIREFGRRLAAALVSVSGIPEKTSPAILRTGEYLPSESVSVSRHEFEPSLRSSLTQSPGSDNVFRIVKWASLLALVFAVLSVPTIYIAYRYYEGPKEQPPINGNTNPSPEKATPLPSPAHELSYSLSIQKWKNRTTPDGEPFPATGREIFMFGFSVSIHFRADDDGYLYIINEGPDDRGKIGYYALFPTPEINSGSSAVSKSKELVTQPNRFSGGKGTEIMWMVWSKSRVDQLEQVFSDLGDMGAVLPKYNYNLKDLLEQNKLPDSAATENEEEKRIVLRSPNDLIVHRFTLQHR